MLPNKYSRYESGQGLVEYALIFVGVALVVIIILSIAGTSLGDVYCQIIGGLGSQSCGGELSDSGSKCDSSFDDPSDLENWAGTGKDDYLTIENGKVCNSGPRRSYLNGCSEDFGDSDFSVDLKGITIEKTSNGNTGFDYWFRAQDDNNGYHFTYNSKHNLVRFWKQVDGKWIRLSTKNVPSDWGNQENDFQIQVEGNTFTAYKDGEPILQATDGAYTQGKYGIRNKPGSKTCFDDISFQQ